MDVEDFTHEVQPHHKRSRLLKFKEQIGKLKRLGYSDMQVRDWLAQSGCDVSRENVRKFIKRNFMNLNTGTQSPRPNMISDATITEQEPQQTTQSNSELEIGAKESAAKRIQRLAREQRDEANQTQFKHDKIGNNH